MLLVSERTSRLPACLAVSHRKRDYLCPVSSGRSVFAVLLYFNIHLHWCRLGQWVKCYRAAQGAASACDTDPYTDVQCTDIIRVADSPDSNVFLNTARYYQTSPALLLNLSDNMKYNAGELSVASLQGTTQRIDGTSRVYCAALS